MARAVAPIAKRRDRSRWRGGRADLAGPNRKNAAWRAKLVARGDRRLLLVSPHDPRHGAVQVEGGWMGRVPSFDPIEYLVWRKFHIRGPGPQIYRGQPLGYCGVSDKTLTAYRSELAKKTPAEIHELVRTEKQKERDELEEHRSFNQPSARADFDHYCKAAYWTLDECIALSFGKDPKRVNWQSVKPFVEVSPFAQSYEKRKDLTLRAVSAKQLSDPVSPGTYLTWARRHDIRLPDDLINRALNSGISIEGPADPTPTTSEKTLGAKERESLLKLVIGMAVGWYGFDPHQARNQATKEIWDDIRSLRLSIDDDTVRKYLKQASELLDGDALHNLPRKPKSVKR